MSTIQLLEAKFDGLEQRLIRVEADVALLKVNMTVLQSQMNLLQSQLNSLTSMVQRERDERLAFQNTVINILGNVVEKLDKIDERLVGTFPRHSRAGGNPCA